MNNLLKKFAVICFALCSISLYSIENDFEGKHEDSDMDALRKWIQDKRMITVKELGGALSLSAEVRTEGQAKSEVKNGREQRGPHGATGKPMFSFDVEVNLMLDYRADRTWASIKIEYDNDMGTMSGTTNKLQLEKAFFGGRAIAGDTFTLDIELGRRFLFNAFDSKIEFSSIFDGILFRFSKVSPSIGDAYFNLGGLIVNDSVNQFAYAFELGLLRIANTGFFTKYSFIDWKKTFDDSQPDGAANNLRFNFRISQLMAGYQITPPQLQKLIKFYAAALYNHSAKPLAISNHRRANYAWYAGVSIGAIQKKGSWALDANYQLVAPQAIPDFDVNGIKRGNAAEVGFYTTALDPRRGQAVINTSRKNAVGSCNYKGVSVELLYAITNNLTMFHSVMFSSNQDKAIGPMIRFYQYELEFIYAF